MRKVKTNRRNRIFGLFAMFAMAIGVGVSLAPKEVVKVEATTTYTETFDNMTMSGSSYGSGSHTGAHGGTWTYSDARGDLTMDGKALLLRAGSLKTTITEGLSKIMFDYDRAFTGTKARSYKVYANDELLDTITVNATANERKTYISTDLEYEGSVSIEIEGIGAQKMIDNVVLVTYDSGSQFGTLDRITLDYSAAKTNFAVMETYSSAGLKVTAWDAQNNSKEVFTATTDFDEVTFGSQHKGTHTVTVSYTEGVTKTATYPITVTEARLFTEAKASELNVGATYTIVDPKTGMAIGAFNSGSSIYNNVSTIGVDGPPKAILDNDDILEFELEEGNTLGSYAFKILNTEDAGKYISYTGSSNQLHIADTITNASSWNVSDTEVRNVGSNTRIIKYNPSAPRFAAYTSGQNDVKLYVDLDTVVAEPEYETTTKIEVSAGAVKDTWYVHETFAADGLVVVAHDENNGVHKILEEGEYSVDLEGTTFTGAHLGQQEVIVTYDGKSDSFSIDVLEPRAFAKVTDMSQVQVGGEYVIVGEDDGDVYALAKNEGNNRRSVGVAAIDDNVFQNFDVQILKLHEGAETVPGSYAFESLGGDKDGMYLAATSTTSNYLQSRSDIDEKSSWMISLTGGVFSVIAEEAGTTRNEMRFNDTDLLFSAYGSGQSPVALYVDVSSITQVDPAYAEAEQFANFVMSLTDKGDVTTDDCEDNFLAAWLEWDELSPEAKAEFKTHADFAEARARLTHWAFVNGGYTLDDLDGGAGVQAESVINNPINATLIIGLLGLTTIAGYYFLTKKEKLVK